MKSFWKSHFLTLCFVCLDTIALSLIWRLAWDIEEVLHPRFFQKSINDFSDYSHALPLLLPLWLVTLAFFKQYAHHGRISSLNQAGDIIKASLALLVGTLAAAHLLKRYQLGIAVILIAALGMMIFLYVSRSILRYIKETLRKQGHGLTRVAIIGAGATGQAVAERIRTHPEVGYELVGFIDRDAVRLGKEVGGIPVIGGAGGGTGAASTASPVATVATVADDIANILLRYRVEEVFLAIPSLSQSETFALVLQCEMANVHFKIVKNNMLAVITERVKIDDIGEFPVILLRQGRLTPFDALLKRALDIVLTIPLLIAAAPLWLIIAILIKLDSPGPILFAHERVGQDGKVFKLFKFRTMTSDTNPYAVAPGDQSDPRITRFGRFLRKTSLDELPQFWNVLLGQMSLVGPRPEMPFIVEQYEPWQRRRLDVPQGITGLWQIAGRKQLPLHFNLEYDFYYIRNWSILLDLVILARTLPAVLYGRGAF